MGRRPSPYIKDGWYRTNFGGTKHRKLCPVSEGMRKAETALARLMVQTEEQKRLRENPAAMPDPLANTNQAVGQSPHSPLVATALEEFLTHKQTNVRPGTYQWLVEHLELLNDKYGDRPINSLSHVDADQFKHFLIHERKNERTGKIGDFSPATVNHELRACKQFCNWCCSVSRRGRYQLMVSPFAETKLLEDAARERVIQSHEWDALFANVSSGNCLYAKEEMREILTVMRYTTMRPGEILTVRWEYIDWAVGNERIVVPANEVKTGSKREMTLLQPLIEALKVRRARFDRMGKPQTGLIFSRPSYIEGKRCSSGSETKLDIDRLDKRFRRLKNRCIAKGLIQAEVKGETLVPYSSRHTRITQMFEHSTDMAVVQFEAGHTNPMTTQRYKHLQGAFVAKKVREAFEKATSSDENENSEEERPVGRSSA